MKLYFEPPDANISHPRQKVYISVIIITKDRKYYFYEGFQELILMSHPRRKC